MDVYTSEIPTPDSQPPEIRLKARSVSRGIASGKVVCLHGKKRQFYRISLRSNQIEREVKRFRSAVRLATQQLKRFDQRNRAKNLDSASGILEVHLMILEDVTFLASIESAISESHVNAEWAVKLVSDKYITKFKAMPDEHLRTRFIDIEDVSDRLLTALGGGRGRSNIRLDKNSVIVAKEINPSTLVELCESDPRALITEHGGWTSHTFILAREFELPAVTGIKRILRRVNTGDSVIVDGNRGQVILNPTPETLANYEKHSNGHQTQPVRQPTSDSSECRTLDGRRIIVRANVDIPKAYLSAKRLGAKGIGLYRSEFLFNQFRGFPAEHIQIEAYKKIASIAGEDGVKIRTFDVSADQLAEHTYDKEKNPALGLRAIRLSLTYQKQFRMQLRAILAASLDANIDIVLPMISDVSEVRLTRQFLELERKALLKRGIQPGTPRLGAMVEVPSAVLTIDDLAAEVDFLCVGTNDLVQYLLAVDRDNEAVADWFRTLHPSVIRAVKLILEAGLRHGKPVVICGEMAGSPVYTPILIGLGATELSMNVNSIPRIRKLIAGIAFEEAFALITEIMRCTTADAAEKILFNQIESKWRHLFPDNILSNLQA